MSSEQQLPQLTFTQVRDELAAEIANDLKHINDQHFLKWPCKVGLMGPPGVGKTSCIRAVPAALQEQYGIACSMLVMFLPARDPTDQTGLPLGRWVKDAEGNEQAVVEFAQAQEIIAMYNADHPLLVLWDELPAAAPSTENSAARLLGGDAFNAARLSPYVTHAWTGNATGHKAGSSGVLSHIAGRTQMVCEFKPIVDDPDGYGLVQYFIKRGYEAWLAAFLRAFPQYVNLTGEDLNKDGRKSADPRSIEAMALKLKRGVDDPSILACTVGLPFATQYLEWREVAQQIPDWRQIIQDPENAPLPNEHQPGVMYALASSLVYHTTVKTIGQIATYMNRLMEEGHGEFSVYWAKDLLQKEDGQKVAATKEFKDWSLENAHLFGV
jgi:hypothetical protein